jgi:hypothetical protein
VFKSVFDVIIIIKKVMEGATGKKVRPYKLREPPIAALTVTREKRRNVEKLIGQLQKVQIDTMFKSVQSHTFKDKPVQTVPQQLG